MDHQSRTPGCASSGSRISSANCSSGCGSSDCGTEILCAFPVTQIDLADATGLSAVHVNRTLQELRSSGLIVMRDRLLTVNDLDALRSAAMFNPDYLHYAALS